MANVKRRPDAEQVKIKKQMLAEITYLMMQGKNQKQCAEILEIAETTVCRWLKKAPKLKAKIDAYLTGQIDNPFKLDDTISGYMADLRITNPNKYRQELPYISTYRNKVSKL